METKGSKEGPKDMNRNTMDLEKQILFEAVYKKYSPAICNYAQYTMCLSRQEAEDITSEAFLALLQSWSHIEKKTYPALFAWLRTAVHFLIQKKNQKEQKLSLLSFEEISDVASDTDLQASFMARSGYDEKLQLIRDNLKFDEYQLFEDVVIQRHEFLQIARKQKVNVDAVYVRWHRLRKKIQIILQKGRD